MSDDPNNSGDTGGRSLGGGSNEPLPPSWGRPSNPRLGRIGDWAGSNNSGSSGNSRFGTIGGLQSGSSGGRPPPADNDDSDDDEDKRESWFTGGERSGLSVQNPTRQQSQVPGGDMVRDLLRRAAEAGPAQAPPVTMSGAFSGGGHILGGEEKDSEYIPDPNAPSPSEQAPQIRHLTFWRDGFTVEDGALFRYDDPANNEILAQINAGVAPPSILGVRPNEPVEVRVAKRTNEDYVPPAGVKAFTGAGNRLGAPVPEAVPSSTSSSMPGSFPAAASSSGASIPPPRENITTRFEVDQSLPTTSVQIRLADGTRMVCRMNLTHTVQDIRNFINASRPENLTRPYEIATTFPSRTLEDGSATIEAAGLKNSVVVQKWA